MTKANTLQQRFGFNDSDLKTPKHDEMMLWLDGNMQEVLTEFLGIPGEWDPKEVTRIKDIADNLVKERISKHNDDIKDCTERIENNKGYLIDPVKTLKEYKAKLLKLSEWSGLGDPPQKPKRRINELIWEYPIVSKQYTIGFIDMFVRHSLPTLVADGIWGLYSTESCHLHGEYIPKWECQWRDKGKVAIEIKTAIPSLGELVRQIRMYKTYLDAEFLVVCPDDRFAEPLRSQGIGFYKYEIKGQT